MMKKVILGVGVWSVFVSNIWAYEVETHQDISEAAALLSVLERSDLLSEIGLNLGLDDPDMKLPNSKGVDKTIKLLIRDGAKFEDNFPRFLNHFYDPLQNRPLQNISIYDTETSPDWALEDMSEFDTQNNSYLDAQNFYYEALTIPTGLFAQADEETRKENFGLTFQRVARM